MMSMMDINDIRKYVPHRFPFLLIDRVVALVEGESIVALKNVTVNEPHFTGHFPENPIMPGVLILEALAQAACILAFKSTNTLPSDGDLYLFAGIDNARFKKMVVPGDALYLHVSVDKVKRDIWKLQGVAKVDDQVVCSADLLSAKKEMRSD